MMLESIHIRGFKNFKDTKIQPLRKVNLILGGQNVGKTSLLEAVWLGEGNVQKINSLPSVFRLEEDGDGSRFLESVFKKDDIFITTLINDGYILNTFKDTKADYQYSCIKLYEDVIIGQSIFKKHSPPLVISINPKKQNDAVLLMEDVVVKRKKRILLNLLEKIEVRLLDVNSLSIDSQRRVYVELDGLEKAIPLPQLGHGFSRLFHLYCSLLVTDSKLALIDEIENGIHYSSLPTMFKGIQQIAADNDIQSLITTHSWECLRAACEVFSDKPELFQVIRLERDGDNTKAVCIEGERMLRMMERDMEVR